MARISRRYESSGFCSLSWTMMLLLGLPFVLLFFLISREEPNEPAFFPLRKSLVLDPNGDPVCSSLPTIRPDGVFFLDSRVKKYASPAEVEPSFHIGSRMEGVSNHMKGDLAHFNLVSEHFSGKPKRIAFDLGANQGFFTYYLATLGFQQVHAFEINKDNFNSLQHGRHYNPKQVSDRVLLYPVGISKESGRLGMKGGDYQGFLAPDPNGSILSVTFDCFVSHVQPDLSKVDFVKIDVEGFEVGALQSMKDTLLQLPNKQIGALLMEVGPSRWKRAGSTMDDGLEMLQGHLAKQLFTESHILIRSSGSHWKTCPPSLVEGVLADKDPRIINGTTTKMYKIQLGEWKPLLTKMQETGADCNFWFSN